MHTRHLQRNKWNEIQLGNEISQRLKCLLHKQEDQSSDPRSQVNAGQTDVLPVTPVLRGQTQDISRINYTR